MATEKTIEEAAQKRYPINRSATSTLLDKYGLNYVAHTGFVEGATWQAKKMYTKEQLLEAFSESFGQGDMVRDEYKSRVMHKLNLDRFELF